MCISLIYVTEEKHETQAHLGFEGCPGGAEVKISQHHRDLDPIPGCGASGSVGHSDHFAAKGIYGSKANSLLHFRTQKWTALGPENRAKYSVNMGRVFDGPYSYHDTFCFDDSGVIDSSSSPVVELCVNA